MTTVNSHRLPKDTISLKLMDILEDLWVECTPEEWNEVLDVVRPFIGDKRMSFFDVNMNAISMSSWYAGPGQDGWSPPEHPLSSDVIVDMRASRMCNCRGYEVKND